MAKYYQIRWTKEDLKELNRVVRNFNAKISRISKQQPNMKYILPEKVKVRELKNLINTRRDLMREINSLKRFTKRGAEDVVIAPGNEYELKITKWQKAEMLRRVAVINRRRAKRLAEISTWEATEGGEPLGYRKIDVGMGTIDENELKPMNAFTRTMNRPDVRQKWLTIRQGSQSNYFKKKDMLLRKNYIRELELNFREDDIKAVIEKIENMDLNEFLQKFEDFDEVYVDDETKYQAQLTKIRSIWLPNKKIKK